MEFLWGCMMLTLKVAVGSLCWSIVIAIPIIILGIIVSMMNN